MSVNFISHVTFYPGLRVEELMYRIHRENYYYVVRCKIKTSYLMPIEWASYIADSILIRDKHLYPINQASNQLVNQSMLQMPDQATYLEPKIYRMLHLWTQKKVCWRQRRSLNNVGKPWSNVIREHVGYTWLSYCIKRPMSVWTMFAWSGTFVILELVWCTASLLIHQNTIWQRMWYWPQWPWPN